MDFGVYVLGFGFWVLGFGFQVLGFWCCVLGIGVRASGLEFEGLGFEFDLVLGQVLRGEVRDLRAVEEERVEFGNNFGGRGRGFVDGLLRKIVNPF